MEKVKLKYTIKYTETILFFFVEIDLLSPISGSANSLDFNVRRVAVSPGEWAFLFGRAIKDIRANEDLLQRTIVNIESNEEFLIFARVRVMSGSAGCLFSISHRQKKLLILDLSTKGSGNATKLILRYRSTNDTAENVVFKNVAALGDKQYHSIILRITDIFDKGKKISAVALYVDCRFFGKAETVSAVSSIFSYRGTLLSLMEFRIAQRVKKQKIHTQWKVK